MIRPFQIVRFEAPKPGKHLLVLGAVHGDEICGPAAIDALVPEIASGALPLVAGRVTFVPVCNPQAYAQGQRYIDHNLNRDLRRREKPVDYEDHLANLLCPLLEECDVLLDCHSYAAQGPAFIWAGVETPEEQAFCRCLGPEIELFGWAPSYARLLGQVDGTIAIGTTEYMRQFGGMGVTLECGSNQDPRSVDVARLAIRRAMAFCGLCAAEEGVSSSFPLKTRGRLEEIYWQQDRGTFVKDWHHMDAVAAGETIALREDGTSLCALQDGFIIFPRADCPVGDEWFYFGVNAPRE